MGWVVNAMPRPFYPKENPVAVVQEAGLGPRAGLDR